MPAGSRRPNPTSPRPAGGYPRPELLASTEWLAANIDRPEVRILDVRWRPDGTSSTVYTAGHIPGAVHLDWTTDLTDPDDERHPHLLAGPERVAEAMARSGVGDGTTVVVYDDTASLIASRVWWSLRVYGLESVRVLDGGYGAWVAEDQRVSHTTPIPRATTFTPRALPRLRLSTTDVRGLLGSEDVLLLDARAAAEFKGHEGNARRLGHIPGAINVPVATMTEPGTGLFRPAETLRSGLVRAGVTRGRRLICYDGSGVAAAKLAFVLMLLGNDDVSVYDGGWAEWGDRLDLPVDR